MTALLLAAAAGAGIGGLGGWLARTVLARQDPVTGLPTRHTWTRQARRILRRGTHTVTLIDLDDFKAVNDTYGHPAGDHVLAATAARMRAWASRCGGAACGRLGGDEFTIITRRPITAAETADLAAARGNGASSGPAGLGHVHGGVRGGKRSRQPAPAGAGRGAKRGGHVDGARAVRQGDNDGERRGQVCGLGRGKGS